jgi:hypothetical protein
MALKLVTVGCVPSVPAPNRGMSDSSSQYPAATHSGARRSGASCKLPKIPASLLPPPPVVVALVLSPAVVVPVALSVVVSAVVPVSGPVTPILLVRKLRKEGPKYLRLAKLTIDGIEVPNVEGYKVTSPPTNMSFPQGAVWGAPEGNYTLVGSGIMPIIKPLPPGNHIITFQGIFDHPTDYTYDVAVDVTYNLIVK